MPNETDPATKGKDSPIDWSSPPPIDQIGEARNAEIERFLKESRTADILQNSLALVVSPEGESFDSFRNRVALSMGKTLDLPDGYECRIATDCFAAADKKRLAGMEPTVLVFVVDPGGDIQEDESKMIMRMTKALRHFLFIVRSLGLSQRCSVIVLIARYAHLSQSAIKNKESWERLFPSLRIGETFQGAIEAEFEAMANTLGGPASLTVYFDDEEFRNLTFLRSAIQESIHAVAKSFFHKIGEQMEPDKFHDAGAIPSDEITTDRRPFEKPVNPSKFDTFKHHVSRVVFLIELCLFIFGFFAIIPWDELSRFLETLIDVLRIPKLV